MKCELKAKDWKDAIKATLALQAFGKEKLGDDIGNSCLLTVTEDGKLIIEAASNGAHLRKEIPAKTLRPGSACISSQQIDKRSKYLSGTLTIDVEDNEAHFLSGKTHYTLPIDSDAAESISSNRPKKDGSKAVAQVPFDLLKEGASTTSFQPSVKEEDLYIHLSIRPDAKNGSLLSISGVDQYSSGNFRISRKDIRSKEAFQVVLASDMLKKILQHLDGEKIIIRYLSESSLIQFQSESFVLSYPTLDEEYKDLYRAMKEALDGGTLDGFVETTTDRLIRAVDAVKVVNTTPSDPLMLKLRLWEDKARMEASDGAHKADADVETTEVGVDRKGDYVININQFAFYNFLKLLPRTFPVRVESWNENTMKLFAMKTGDQLSIEFMIAMG